MNKDFNNGKKFFPYFCGDNLYNLIAMKKITILLAILMATCWARAQTYDSIAHHKVGWYDIDMRDDMIQLRDGSILAHVQLFEVDEQGYYVGDYGNRFYKISRHGAVIVDSVFIADNDLNWFLLKRNPLDDDNVFAKLVRDLDNHRTNLSIRFFDDDLNFKPEKEVFVPMFDTLFPPLWDAYMLDEQGDIILYYLLPEGHVFSRVGLDGVVKGQSPVIPFSACPVRTHVSGQCLAGFGYQDAKYAFWGFNDFLLEQLHVVGLDSTLNVSNVLTPDDHPQGILFKYMGKDRFLDWDDNSFLIASRFDVGSYDGARVTRYDKETLSAMKTCYFRTFPQVLIGSGSFGCAFPFGLAKTGDGNMYFAYCTQDPTPASYGNPCGQVSVVKMDADFNIIWQRFCLEPYGYSRVGSDMAVLDDGSVAVGGVIYGTPPEVFVLVFDNNGWVSAETNSFVRPYTYYPNPVQDQLHLLFSPDVKPTHIELYDLQGRLVKTQRNGLESLNLQGLATGTYTVRVALEGGKTFSDKVVKE